MSHAGNRIDLEAYSARIGYTGATEPKPQALADLHLAYVPLEDVAWGPR